MDGTRSNIFDCFTNESDAVYTELQPAQAASMPDYDVPSWSETPPMPTVSELLFDENESDHPLQPFSDGGIYGADVDCSSIQNSNWVPDDDLIDNGGNLDMVESDESSDGEENADILLAESDPEPEMDNEPEETSSYDETQFPLPNSSNILLSKNGSVVWSKIPIPQVGRTPTRNVYRPPKSHVKHPKNVDSIASSFHLILNEKMIKEIMKMTNQEGVRTKGRNWKPVDLLEMKALLGLYIHLGARKLNLLGVAKIWYGATADNVALCTMSMRRFIDLSTAVRFDDKETRCARRNRDVFAPLRDLFSEVNKNLQRHYAPSACLTVDEQLVPWRGRCKFLQFLPSKPDKYGLKLFLICDSETAYPLQAIPYLGKHGERKTNLGREIVKDLVTPYYRTGRNVTCDNFFCDLELANHLSRNGLSLVGTVRRNKAFLPISFQTGKEIKKYESSFLFTEEESLVAHKSNDKKHVVVLSTMHHSPDVDEEGKRKPVMVKYYNQTKGGVDTFDYMCHSFSCKRKTRRWPMVLFFNLLDTATIAAHIIYKEVFPKDSKVHKDRGKFNELLAKELILEHLMRRMEMSRTTQRVRLSFEVLKLEWGINAGDQAVRQITPVVNNKRKAAQGRCSRCPRKKDRKVKQTCTKCDILVCNEHSSVVCHVCK